MATQELMTKMAKFQEEDLVRIAFGDERDGFEGDYVEAARRELEQRGISPLRVENLKLESAEIQFAEDAKQNEPLGTFARALFFVFGAFWLAWLATAVLKYRGYEQKFRDAWRWIFYGFGLWAIIAALFVISDLTGK